MDILYVPGLGSGSGTGSGSGSGASAEVRYSLSDCDVSTGAAALADRAVNRVSLDGPPEGSSRVSLAFPAARPRLARDFLVLVRMESATPFSFTGAGAFLSDDAGVFAEVRAGETVLYSFTEVEPGRFLAARKRLEAVA